MTCAFYDSTGKFVDATRSHEPPTKVTESLRLTPVCTTMSLNSRLAEEVAPENLRILELLRSPLRERRPSGLENTSITLIGSIQIS